VVAGRQLTGDDLRVTGLEVSGGASDIEITLPAPIGIVPVRVSGGFAEATDRDEIRFTGGASQVTVAAI
jgi:hypothetical protein